MGVPLFLTARDESALLSLEKELEKTTSVLVFAADLSSPSELALLLQKITLYGPDLIINNAGLGLYGDILSFSLEEQMQMVQVNIDALVRISIESARALKNQKKKGTIVNISSMAGHFTYPYFTLYAASKLFVQHFSLSLDAELSSQGIRVLTSVLGRFASPFFKKASKVAINPNSWDVMSLSKTASLVLRQIEKQKNYDIIDYRYKILQFFSYFIPKKITTSLLRRKM